MSAPNSTIEKSYRVAIGALAAAASLALLYYGRLFFITVVVAFIIAFLLEPVVRLFMRIRVPRGLASFLVCSISLVFLYLAGLGLYTQGLAMADDLPAYAERINELVDSAAARMEAIEKNVSQVLQIGRAHV